MLLWMLAVTHADVLARFAHALSDPTRARVMLSLVEAPAYPADLAETIGVSRQACRAIWRACGVVAWWSQCRRAGGPGMNWPTPGSDTR